MTAIRVRKFDLERLKKYAKRDESTWETFSRLLTEIELKE